jgi:hypothetical protein
LAFRINSRNAKPVWSDLVIEQSSIKHDAIKSQGGITGGRGISESSRHMWILSLNHLASIHEAKM